MKHQQVSVDYWAVAKAMLMYGGLTVLGWLMLRLFNAVFTLPRRLRTQQEHIQATLQEFQRRYPDLQVTEEDLRNAEKELEEWKKEVDNKMNESGLKDLPEITETPPAEDVPVEEKKSN
ncbi:uncharacterized protein LOC142973861 [Anticarsia gemmatalis]|uniref:uncharacterized protein LOC142973861 n=1 Tax=Anticarsia gemmatalis TaxID=129554 RepID=UPI003F774E44